MQPVNRKGILSFLAITFGITYAVEIPLVLSGFRLVGITSSAGQVLILPVMFAPALGAILTARFVTREGFGGMFLRFGGWKPYLVNALLFPLLFGLVYGVTWLLGLGQPDWELDYFKGLFIANNLAIPAIPDLRLVWSGLFFATLTTGALFNGVFCFGEELGWRGYLLPRLLPLGKLRAYLLLGLVWSAWHWPLVWIGFVYNQAGSLLALLAFTALTTLLGVYLNELTLHHRSAILAGWVHGVFNAQKVGVWFLLFPQINPYLGGYAGLVGLAAWASLGLWQLRQKT